MNKNVTKKPRRDGTEQGRIYAYQSRVRVGRGSDIKRLTQEFGQEIEQWQGGQNFVHNSDEALKNIATQSKYHQD